MVSILITKGMFEPNYNDLKSNSLKPQLLLHQANNISYIIPQGFLQLVFFFLFASNCYG